jgi:hypothetical protein
MRKQRGQFSGGVLIAGPCVTEATNFTASANFLGDTGYIEAGPKVT